jgi:hypothetical protein
VSEVSQGPDWWQAADGKWYPPGTQPTLPGGFPPVAQYCVTCGGGLVATAAICPRCGTPVSGTRPGQVGAKSRTAAVLLAVFFSFWSFLYTYRTSAWKFWLGLGLTVFSFILGESIVYATHNPGGAAAWGLIAVGVWIWSIVDRSTKPL